MKKIILLLFSITLFSFISTDQAVKKESYFEGQIIYDIEYIPNHVKMSLEEIERFAGSKMVFTFKKGNYKKEFFSPDGVLVQETIFKKNKNMSYSRSHHSDTIYYSDVKKNHYKGASENPLNTTFEILSDTTIQNHPCVVVKRNLTYQNENPNIPIYESEETTIYAKDLAVNPDWFSDYNEGRYNEIIAYAKGIFIMRNSKDAYWEQKMKFKSIRPRLVADSELEMVVDENTPFKEL